jgi:hypothetical protein
VLKFDEINISSGAILIEKYKIKLVIEHSDNKIRHKMYGFIKPSLLSLVVNIEIRSKIIKMSSKLLKK